MRTEWWQAHPEFDLPLIASWTSCIYSVFNLGTSWKVTLIHRWEVKPIPPSTCLMHAQLWSSNGCIPSRLFLRAGVDLDGIQASPDHLPLPLTNSTHIFIILALVVWRHSAHPSLAIFVICRERGFLVLSPTHPLSSTFLTLSSLRHCSERPCLKLLTASSLWMTNASVKRRQTRS
jgi:hypothetical protein